MESTSPQLVLLFHKDFVEWKKTLEKLLKNKLFAIEITGFPLSENQLTLLSSLPKNINLIIASDGEQNQLHLKGKPTIETFIISLPKTITGIWVRVDEGLKKASKTWLGNNTLIPPCVGIFGHSGFIPKLQTRLCKAELFFIEQLTSIQTLQECFEKMEENHKDWMVRYKFRFFGPELVELQQLPVIEYGDWIMKTNCNFLSVKKVQIGKSQYALKTGPTHCLSNEKACLNKIVQLQGKYKKYLCIPQYVHINAMNTFLFFPLANMDLAGLFAFEQGYLKYVMLCVARGLQFIHSHGIAHLDVKPQNILVFMSTRQIKLTDFGWGTTEEKCSHLSGTEIFAAPEVIKWKEESGSPYSPKKADVWSLCESIRYLMKESNFQDPSLENLLDAWQQNRPEAIEICQVLENEINPKQQKKLLFLCLEMIIRANSIAPNHQPSIASKISLVGIDQWFIQTTASEQGTPQVSES